MTDRHLWVGDSTVALYSWPDQVVTARSGAGATSVARSPVDTINSPAYSGTALMDYTSAAVLLAWSTRVAPYITACDRLYFGIGINDLYAMGAGVAPAITMESWRDAWRRVNVNYLAASPRPAKVYVIGLPWITGATLTASAMPPCMGGHWQAARRQMNLISRDACARYGWTFVSLDAFSPDQLIDIKHPNPSGEALYVSQILAAG